MASPLQAKISQKLDQRLDAMITRLHQAKGVDDYKSEDFLADVKKIAVEFNKGRLNTIDSSVTALKREFIALSSELNKEDNEEFIKELKAWYGRYDFEIPHEFIRKYYVKKR